MKNNTLILPATYVRGGTSRAVIFNRDELPGDMSQWKAVFRSVLGSPDPDGNQLDGLGGGITSLSKVAVVSCSARDDADVDYFFFQIDPVTGDVLTDANCGNISSSIGPYALSQKWIEIAKGMCSVRIYNVNTGKIIISEFNPDAGEHELVEISGVPGRHFPIRLSFLDPAGSMSGGLFPTGNKKDLVRLDDGTLFQATLIDATVPCVIIRAEDAGIRGDEDYSTLAADRIYVKMMSELRVKASLMMQLCQDEHEAHHIRTNVPDIVVISPARKGLEGITARYVSCDRPHRAAPVTSSMALAAACCIKGTIASDIFLSEKPDEILIHHPSGTISVKAEVAANGAILYTSVIRTMRFIMRGEVMADLPPVT